VPSPVATIPTARLPPVRPGPEPWKVASPNATTPPSSASSQYPRPVGVAAIPTMGRLRAILDRSPYQWALPALVTSPLDHATQKPRPPGVGAAATAEAAVLGAVWTAGFGRETPTGGRSEFANRGTGGAGWAG
jgi:hypothetical protein